MRVQGAREEYSDDPANQCEHCINKNFKMKGTAICETACCKKKLCDTCIRVCEFDFEECLDCDESVTLPDLDNLWFAAHTAIYCAGHSPLKECADCGHPTCDKHLEIDGVCHFCKTCIFIESPELPAMTKEEEEEWIATHTMDSTEWEKIKPKLEMWHIL